MVILIDSYSETNQDNVYFLYGALNTTVGQAIVNINSVNLIQAKFYIKKTLNPTGTCRAVVYMCTGIPGSTGKGIGSVLAGSDTIDVTILPTSYTLTSFTFSTPYTLLANTNYVIGLEYTGGNATNHVDIGVNGGAGGAGHPGNTCTATPGWTSVSNRDTCFYTYASTTSMYICSGTTCIRDDINGTFTDPNCGGTCVGGSNLLLNPGFESGTVGNPNNWGTYTSAGSLTYTYPEIGRLGGSSVAISTSSTLNNGSWVQSVNINPTKTYKVSGYMKTQNISSNAIVQIDWFYDNTSASWIRTTEIATATGTSPDWFYYEKILIPVDIPSNAVRGNVLLKSWYSSGKVWFDDIMFAETNTVISPKIETLQDDFNDNSLDINKWNYSNQVTEINNELEITTTTTAGYYFLHSLNKYDLTSSYVFVKLVIDNPSLVYNNTGFWVWTSNNQLLFQVVGNILYANTIIGTTQTTINTAIYNSTNHKWLRIRESGGIIYWDYSASGILWTNFAYVTNSGTINNMTVELSVERTQTAPGTTISRFDNLNILCGDNLVCNFIMQ